MCGFSPQLSCSPLEFGQSEGGSLWTVSPHVQRRGSLHGRGGSLAPSARLAQASPVWLALIGHSLQGRGSWKELKKYHMTQAMMVL